MEPPLSRFRTNSNKIVLDVIFSFGPNNFKEINSKCYALIKKNLQNLTNPSKEALYEKVIERTSLDGPTYKVLTKKQNIITVKFENLTESLDGNSCLWKFEGKLQF